MSLNRLAKTGLFRRLPTEGMEEIRRELILHRSVLDKALVDYFSDTSFPPYSEVSTWLSLDNLDFIDACERAMLPPEKVFETFVTLKKVLTQKRVDETKNNE